MTEFAAKLPAVAIVLALALLYVPAVSAVDCPSDWPFPSCPRTNSTDTEDHTVCCIVYDNQKSCCTEDYVTTWLIVLVTLLAVALIVFIVIMALVCCGFCACVACCDSCVKSSRTSTSVVA
ncbi:uncharacterized protein [Ptychodera flava]|uniref:uncharacterized protein n=1 Tax=Ptychodera flava TaxID=63121 RepID=UPI00396A8227